MDRQIDRIGRRDRIETNRYEQIEHRKENRQNKQKEIETERKWIENKIANEIDLSRISTYLYLYISISIYPTLRLSLFLSLHIYIYTYIYVSISIYLSIYLCMCVSMYPSISISIFLPLIRHRLSARSFLHVYLISFFNRQRWSNR